MCFALREGAKLHIRGILTSVATVATMTAAAFAAPAVAAASAPAGHLPRAAFSKSLHAQFARLGGHAAMGPRAGIVPPLGAAPASRGPAAKPSAAQACTEPNCDMPWNQGPVQHSPRVYVLFWGPTWQSNSGEEAAAAYLISLYSGLGASGDTWSVTNSQYSDSSGHPTFGKGVYVEDGFDTSAPPSEVTPDNLATEATVAAANFGITDLADAQVVVASQSGTCFSDGFAGSSCTPVQPAYCAWHSSTFFNSGELSFTNLPYQLDAGDSCGQDFIANGTESDLDGFSIVGGHEYAEAVTDPDPDSGWIDLSDNVSGGEIGDKCAWGGQLWGTPDPDGNVTLSTGKFAMQSLWSNAVGGCVMASGPLPFTVTPLGNQTGALGHAVSITVHASTTPATPLTFTATGLPSGLSINRTTGLIHGTPSGALKVYTPKVTVAYYDGSKSFGFTWTINAVGQVTGPWAMCVDDAGGKTTGGNKIDLLTCNGKAQQKITYTAGGQLRVQTGCITGGNLAFFEPCSSAVNKTWTRVSSEYVNKATGRCLTDPNNTKVNGTWLTVAACTNKVNQHWSLP